MLVVYAGLADFRTRRANRGFARVRVLIDGQEVAAGTIGSDSGWLALPPVLTSPGRRQIEFEAAVAEELGGQPVKLAVCVAAEARR